MSVWTLDVTGVMYPAMALSSSVGLGSGGSIGRPAISEVNKYFCIPRGPNQGNEIKAKSMFANRKGSVLNSWNPTTILQDPEDSSAIESTQGSTT